MKPKKTEITGEAYYTVFANVLKFFCFNIFFRLHIHKSVTLFLLFSLDKLRKEINKVSRIKLVGTEDHCTYASFIFMSI